MNYGLMLIAAGIYTAFGTILAFKRHGFAVPRQYKRAFVIAGVLITIGAGLI